MFQKKKWLRNKKKHFFFFFLGKVLFIKFDKGRVNDAWTSHFKKIKKFPCEHISNCKCYWSWLYMEVLGWWEITVKQFLSFFLSFSHSKFHIQANKLKRKTMIIILVKARMRALIIDAFPKNPSGRERFNQFEMSIRNAFVECGIEINIMVLFFFLVATPQKRIHNCKHSV